MLVGVEGVDGQNGVHLVEKYKFYHWGALDCENLFLSTFKTECEMDELAPVHSERNVFSLCPLENGALSAPTR